MANIKQIVVKRTAQFRVILKPIPGNDKEVLISPFPQVRDSRVRTYKKLNYDDIAEVKETGEVYSSMGRSFVIADIVLKETSLVPLTDVIASMFDEKVVEPRTSDTWKVSWDEGQQQPKGGIYVMGSCESCWCDNVWC
jgi:hypothetical protein